MESDYFEKIQKRFKKLTEDGYYLSRRRKVLLSLKKLLPELPVDTFCMKGIVFRFLEHKSKDHSAKYITYRVYDYDTDEWSDWKIRIYEYSGVLDTVTFQGKEMYVFNRDMGVDGYFPCLIMYAPELLQGKFYMKGNDGKENPVEPFPWVRIELNIEGISAPDLLPNPDIRTWHVSSTTTADEAKYLCADDIADHYRKEFKIPENINLSPDNPSIKKIMGYLDKGEVPPQIKTAPIHLDYPSALFSREQGQYFIDNAIKDVESQMEKIMPEWNKLKAFTEMSLEEREKFIADEKKKEAQVKKEKAAQRAAKKAEKEAEEKKKSKLFWIGTAVWLITLMSLCGITLALDEFADIEGWVAFAIFAGGIIIVHYIWKAVKKNLKRKWGIKDEK